MWFDLIWWVLRTEIGPKKWAPALQGHWNRHRSIACIWLTIILLIHSNYGPISYRFRNKRRFQSKIANFSNSRVFNTPLRVPFEFYNDDGVQKTRMMPLPEKWKQFAMCIFVEIQYISQRDGRTDGRTELVRHYRAPHDIMYVPTR